MDELGRRLEALHSVMHYRPQVGGSAQCHALQAAGWRLCTVSCTTGRRLEALHSVMHYRLQGMWLATISTHWFGGCGRAGEG